MRGADDHVGTAAANHLAGYEFALREPDFERGIAAEVRLEQNLRDRASLEIIQLPLCGCGEERRRGQER